MDLPEPGRSTTSASRDEAVLPHNAPPEPTAAAAPADSSQPAQAANAGEPGEPFASGPAAQSGAPDRYPIQFTGVGAEYLRIWIVNLVLSILTLGIYSPWAKVRRLRYFYGNTLVDGSAFEFHGSPIALLKGRVVAVILLLAYTQAGKVSVALWLGVVAVLITIFPWLIWKSLRFRLANSSYRGIRFGFDGTLPAVYAAFAPPLLMFAAISGASFSLQRTLAHAPPTTDPANLPSVALMLAPMAVMLALFALSPWFWFRIKRYQHANARLGTAPFTFGATLGDAYGLGLIGVGLSLVFFVLGLVGAALMYWVVSWALTAPGGARDLTASAVAVTAGAIGFYVVFLGIYPFMNALAQNLVWDKTSLSGQSFQSSARGSRLWWIGVENLILLVLTLGLYWPFAVIRTMVYRLQAIAWSGDPAALLAQSADAPVGATGDESVDLLGFDLAL